MTTIRKTTNYTYSTINSIILPSEKLVLKTTVLLCITL